MTEPNLTTRLVNMSAELRGTTDPATLAAVRDAISSLLAEAQDQGVTLADMLGALAEHHAGLLLALQSFEVGIRGGSNATLADMLTEDQYVSSQVQLQSRLADIEQRVATLEEAVGAGEFADLNLVSVRGLLNALYQCCRDGLLGLSPIGGAVAYVSGSSLLIDGRKCAIFGGELDGLDISSNGDEITPRTPGWRAWIQTTDPEPQVSGMPSVPGTWLELQEDVPHSFCVDGRYQITVYLEQGEVAPEECVVIWDASFDGQAAGPGGIVLDYAVPWWAYALIINTDTNLGYGNHIFFDADDNVLLTLAGGTKDVNQLLPEGCTRYVFSGYQEGWAVNGVIEACPAP